MAVGANTGFNRLQNAGGVGTTSPLGRVDSNLNRNIGSAGEGPSFKEVLGSQVSPTGPAQQALKNGALGPLKFSSHAVDRMRSRGIQFDQEVMTKIENAVSRAAQKGAKETLLLTDNSALIVSVKNNTVVTVMDKQSLKDNVFTNIDSTVVI
jgi:flagellar operon protein